MSDLDAVLERLLTDPSFQSALSRNPDEALAGYSLSPDDRELLGVPVVQGEGEERTVELRTTKAGMAGLLGPVVSAFSGQFLGSAPGGGVIGSSPGSGSFGAAPGDLQGAGADPAQSFGYAPQADGSTLGDAPGATETFGAAQATESFGSAAPSAAPTDTMGAAPSAPPLDGYSTRVDVDGDGRWDAHTVIARADGGVDIHADINNDGVVDFIGHDDNRDGLIESADFDTDHDGVLDTRMYDDTGDGWMDRSVPIPPPDGQSAGNAPSASS